MHDIINNIGKILERLSIMSGEIATLKKARANATRAATNASELTHGTINSARLDSDVTKQGNRFNGSSQLVKTTVDGKLPSLDGSLLRNVQSGFAGKSAYEIWLELGNIGTEEEFLNSLKGDMSTYDADEDGIVDNAAKLEGKSANQLDLNGGYF